MNDEVIDDFDSVLYNNQFNVNEEPQERHHEVEKELLEAAAGGSDRETVEEIKTSSPLQFTTQNRLVTIKDYESYIKKNYPSIDSLSVWGGEDEVPAVYGKVLISLKPKGFV